VKTIARARSLTCILAMMFVESCAGDVRYHGRASSEWIRQLDSENRTLRVAAIEALGKILEINPKSQKVVDALTAAVTDTSDDVRLAAATALTAEGVDSRGAVAGFHRALHDSAHADVRASMALIIGALGSKRARVLVPFLSESL
jgi:ribonuclease D